ncbi:putative bifunctional diguanylate cyclase/phosphodiesterase [Noviherbaspirillum sedimenti]|uniref:EAL domain-containing protein n=1 Tax=Noviherbaspirillum sedimenti TaxID=2320865 RepID=A0A3A3G209_9BURK|nr:EAL domain-containing protein [Noviherbaspirillum sedimenti]RJG02528.1 EAL domain-containing protein [Noviherbaspirillum sedimenti]
MDSRIELYERRLNREAAARKQAEALLEQKSQELFERKLQEQKLAETALRESEQRYQLLVELSPDAILIAAEGRITYANAAAARLFGAQEPADLLGYTMLNLAAPACRANVAAAMLDLEQNKVCPTVEEQAFRLDGTIMDIAMTRIAFIYRNKTAVQIVARDISERKRLEKQLNHLATHDALTGLPNRNLLTDRLQQEIAYARHHNRQFMVSFIDLDRFKWINDSLGHEAGDTLLKTVSRRMSGCLRKEDAVARIGGDEFVLFLRHADKDNPYEHMHVVDRVVEAVSTPMTLNGHEVTITCSLGCSSYPDDGQSAEALLQCADAAMYKAKEMGRNKIRLFDPDLRAQIDRKVRLETDLQQAIERDELMLHYQPQVDLQSGRIVGLEALLRWRHPELGEIAPAEFIPLAEEMGLIMPIGAWVIQEACKQNKAWQQAGFPLIRVAVNLSPKQLNHPGLVDFVAGCLSATALDPACLELEFTESASMDDPNTIIPLMHQLKKLGVSLSIDDFGTGYSNMKYLKNFPIDKLKLDGSFVREITTDPRSLAIADAIIAMSHHLGLKVVAEMTETDAQIMLLIARACDQAQGYYFSKPVPAEQCARLLQMGCLPLPTSGKPVLRTLMPFTYAAVGN